MRVVRDTPMEFGQVVWQVQPPQTAMMLVLKGTFRIVPGQPMCELANEQRPCQGVVHFDDDPTQSVRLDTDLALTKTQGEYLLAGTCHAPEGQSVEALTVTCSVGSLEKSLVVVGDRRWEGMLRVPSKIQPFTHMPLRWERSFGGAGFAANPLGRGLGSVTTPAGKVHSLPNLETPSDPVRNPGDRPKPMGFAPLPQTYRARARYLGTYDQRWLRERWPWYPEDFQWTFYNAAPEDQRLQGFWRGDEPVRLTNLHPTHRTLSFRLPGLKTRAFLELFREGQWGFVEVPLQLDTVSIDTDAMELYLLWRGLVTVGSERLEDVRTLFYFHESITEVSSPEEVSARYQRRLLEEDEAGTELEIEEPDVADLAEAPVATGANPAEGPMLQALGPAFAAHGADFASLLALGSKRRVEGPSAKAVVEQLEAGQKEVPEALAAAATLEPEALALDEEPLPEPEPCFTRALLEAMHARKESFAGLDLTGLELSGSALEGADFTDAILTDAKLDGAKLSGACFHGANLHRTRLDGAELREANFEEADLSRAQAREAKAEGAKFVGSSGEGSTWSGSTFEGADFSLADFSGATFEACNFQRATLTGADFSRATLDQSDFLEAILVDTSMENVHAQKCRFVRAQMKKFRASENADFRGSSFEFVQAPEATFSRSNLDQTNFHRAVLTRADFSEGRLVAATLHGADLRNSRFDLAELTGVQMLAANLLEANFEGARLQHADLRGANLFGCQFWRADLRHAALDTAYVERTLLAADSPVKP